MDDGGVDKIRFGREYVLHPSIQLCGRRFVVSYFPVLIEVVYNPSYRSNPAQHNSHTASRTFRGISNREITANIFTGLKALSPRLTLPESSLGSVYRSRPTLRNLHSQGLAD